MDYYFALRIWYNDVMECKDLLTLGMWVLHEVFENGECRMKDEETTFGGRRESQYISLYEPWMIYEPNERVGKRLLEEIMKGGNFGQYDERGKDFKNGGMIKHGLWKLKRVMGLVRSYPEEALWEPVFRVWHLGWRLAHR